MEVQPAGREQLDPEMETDAAAKRIRYGFSTHGRECGLRGRSFRRTVLEQKRERAFTIKHLGREFDLSSGGASKPGGPENRAPKTTNQATEGQNASAD
jgi:capsid protein